MMRNVVLGAVIGFAAVVMLLSVLSREKAPPAQDAVSAAEADAGAAAANLPIHSIAPLRRIPAAIAPSGAHPVFMIAPAPADAGP
jgi:hypothetical protein